ncbi:MAG: bacteriochlorophyll c-binding family protein [Chlorobium phaeobacteroides]|uniref:Bacteriochlorophyll C binding protein n=1 Tax=Chlorobium phaeobacteroides (strain BS1) TaxID=331678 RepID=B3EL02_CHLPB|nr:chlorosome protein E [Chlorobium phaeobacteroides]MBL6955311.1 bacteriochlorophyll c-binding family protein [Chlorobium phaeobacteroides]NEX13441.1 chlorosome protein E [Prosthecochloris sp.]
MSNNSGTFTDWAVAYGKIVEIFTDGHWWVMADYMEGVGKSSKRLLKNAYPYIKEGTTSAGLQGSSPETSGYARPTKAVEQRFKD